jgi:non-homologous end joining protein Ku
MNERIKELALQAKEETDALYAKLTPQEFKDTYNQKFAELIVEECAKKTIQGLMSDPAFVQAMDEHYEKKWAHRFD